MISWKRSIVVFLAAASAASAADPALLNLVPSGTRIVVGASISQFLSSPFGRYLMSQAQSAQPQMNQLLQASGFDPLRDLQEIMLASPGDSKQNRGVVLAKGAFDPARLSAFAQKAGASVETYKGVQVVIGKQNTEGWIAFLNPVTAALGDPASVRALIDRPPGGGLDAAFRARVEKTASEYDFWAVSAVPPSQLAGETTPGQMNNQFNGLMQGDVLKGVLETSGGIKFGSDILVAAEALTRSEKDATALADVVRFLIGMAQMGVQKDPNSAAALAFLQKIQLNTQGNTMRLSLSVPQAELEKIIKQAQTAAKQKVDAATKGAAPSARQPSQTAPPSGGLVIQSSPKDMGTVVVK